MPTTEPFSVLKFVLMTEKAVRTIELQNKLVFIVDRKATKKEIKNAVESAFQTSVDYVNTMIDQKGRKKAFVKFKQPGIAGEIAIKLGII
ncbi:MAG: 50S ribosomal protein L23 [Candidatus Aenigmatarchaeota archaeon]